MKKLFKNVLAFLVTAAIAVGTLSVTAFASGETLKNGEVVSDKFGNYGGTRTYYFNAKANGTLSITYSTNITTVLSVAEEGLTELSIQTVSLGDGCSVSKDSGKGKTYIKGYPNESTDWFSATVTYKVRKASYTIRLRDPDTGYHSGRNCKIKASFKSDVPLSTPKINASSATADGVILAWDNVPNATSYSIYRATSAEGTKTKLKTVSNNTTSDATAVAGTTYYYYVQAYSSELDSSSAYSAARVVKAGKSATAPATPKFNASAGTSSGVILAWDGSKNATSYRLYRANSADGERTLLKIVANTTTTDTTAVSGKVYYYYLTAYNGKTEEVSFFSSARSVIAGQSATAPGTPEITSATAASGAVTLKWNSVPNATSYRVYRSASATGQRDLMKIVANTSSTITAPAGKTYYYFITAYNSKTEEVSFFSSYKTAAAK